MAVLFDLDGTLFDHEHSVRCALSAVQASYSTFVKFDLEYLVAHYHAALKQAYDKYLAHHITYQETEALKVCLFFQDLGLPQPSTDDVWRFRDLYKPAYRASRQPTAGSIETLRHLSGRGFRLGIVTNGQKNDQRQKAEKIGVLDLVDSIITSEEVGMCKPNPGIFLLAVDMLEGWPKTAIMVGDSVKTDIKGALDAGLRPVLYAPRASVTQQFLFGTTVPVIAHMTQLLDLLGPEGKAYAPEEHQSITDR